MSPKVLLQTTKSEIKDILDNVLENVLKIFWLAIYFKIIEFLKIFHFKVNSLALKMTPNAFKLLSNILAIEPNYI